MCAGALIRRVIPAIAAAIAAWSGLLVMVVFWLRRHYQAPLTGTGLINPVAGPGQGVPWVPTPWWIQPGGAPASRFWHFQLIEGGWLLVLSMLLGAATVWLIRHRAT